MFGTQSAREFNIWDLRVFDPHSIEAYVPVFLKFLVARESRS